MGQTVDSRQKTVAMKLVKQITAIGAMAVMLVLAGCRQDMQDQPKFFPQRGTSLFADGRSARPQVENTVARGQLHEDSYFYSGMTGGKEGDGMPFAVTPELMARGQERYNVYCTPCHSRVGNGAGMIVQRGYRPAFHAPPSAAIPTPRRSSQADPHAPRCWQAVQRESRLARLPRLPSDSTAAP